MKFNKITDIDLKNKRVFIRTDMNVPIQDGQITDMTRITASLPTIQYALDQGAKVIIATHLGRPEEGECKQGDSVALIAHQLSKLLHQNIVLVDNLDTVPDFNNYNIAMLENVRCNVGEQFNNANLGKKYAALCDIFVHDAFATAHRKESSTYAVGEFAPIACAGLLMMSELHALTIACQNPIKPIVAIVGGAKVSSKLSILHNLANKVDYLIVGGGILNTFILANGNNVGKSLVEKDFLKEAQQIMQQMAKRGATIPLPTDVVTAKHFSPTALAVTKDINHIETDDMIFDVGNTFCEKLDQIIQQAGTILWNGPIGVFEFEQFSHGTKCLANSIIKNTRAFSLAGGGDTISAINKFNIFDKISYVSTGGGALIEFLGGTTLPGIELLLKRYTA